MVSVEEILSAAAALPASKLARLRAAIERLERDATSLVLSKDGPISFRLYRLPDSAHADALRHSLAIEEDYPYCARLYFARRAKDSKELNFAQVYLTLKAISGESSRCLDDYKMAFSFPFALDVIKGSQTFPYFLEIRNVKDSLYFSLRKMVEDGDKRIAEGRIHQPFEAEFSREQIRYVTEFVYGYLIGRWQCLRPEQLQPFVRRVPASLLIFGYLHRQAFEERFETEEEYEVAWKRLEEQVIEGEVR